MSATISRTRLKGMCLRMLQRSRKLLSNGIRPRIVKLVSSAISSDKPISDAIAGKISRLVSVPSRSKQNAVFTSRVSAPKESNTVVFRRDSAAQAGMVPFLAEAGNRQASRSSSDNRSECGRLHCKKIEAPRTSIHQVSSAQLLQSVHVYKCGSLRRQYLRYS